MNASMPIQLMLRIFPSSPLKSPIPSYLQLTRSEVAQRKVASCLQLCVEYNEEPALADFVASWNVRAVPSLHKLGDSFQRNESSGVSSLSATSEA